MPASAFAIEIGELIPSGIFLLLALVLPFVFYHVGGGFLHRLQKHLPEWLCILTESYLKPLAWALRQTLFFAAVGLLPLVQKHATVASFLGTLSTLLNIYFLALGAWRSAPMCRLLLRSAQNHLDLATNQTMARFFENIFHALVVVFTGIAALDRLGVPYERVDHAPAMTMEVCQEIDRVLNAVICKNLFLCNRQETAFYLLMIPDTKVFHTKDLSAQIGSARLSFAKPEYMEKFLDITPGSVSVLGLMNDKEHQVKLLIDEEVLDSEYFGCHPCINTSSLRMRTADLIEKVLPAMEHDFVKVKL